MTPQDYERMCERHDEEMARKEARIAELTAALEEVRTNLPYVRASVNGDRKNDALARLTNIIDGVRAALAAVGEKK